LHYVARADHLDRTVCPVLAAGRWVICDRFADSTTAYQGYGHGVPFDIIDSLFKAVVGTTAPDLTVILDLPVEQGLRRASARAGHENRYEQMAVEFHSRLRNGFLVIARQNSQRCAVIDASRAVDAVQSDIQAEVRRRLALQ
jgi:dTMP kinase